LAQARFGPETVGPPLGEAEAARDPCPRDIMGAASCRPVAEQVSLESLDARSEPPTCKVSAAAAKSDAELGGVRPDLPRLPTPSRNCAGSSPARPRRAGSRRADAFSLEPDARSVRLLPKPAEPPSLLQVPAAADEHCKTMMQLGIAYSM